MSILSRDALLPDFIRASQAQLAAVLEECMSALPAAFTNAPTLLAIGCSTSEVGGSLIGTSSHISLGAALAEIVLGFCEKRGVCVAAQCCEHLNRVLVVSGATCRKHMLERVVAMPTPEAGGAFASAIYAALDEPVLVRAVHADVGIDIGGVMIGMYVRRVAVPIRLTVRDVGYARVTAAYSRPEYVGGLRASYPTA